MELRCNRQALYETAEELHNLSTEILSIKQHMDTIHLNDAFSGYKWDIMPYRQILQKVTEDLVEELQGMLALQMVLSDSADAYGRTEQDIMALQNGLTYSPKMLLENYTENTKGLICYASGYGIIEEQEKWYQSNEFKLILSVLLNIGLGAANIYLGGSLTPLLKASLVASVGVGMIDGTTQSLSGGEFYDGFSDGSLRGTVGTIALGGMQTQLANVGYGSAKVAIGTKALFGAVGTDAFYSADSLYHGQETTLAGHLFALGSGGLIEAIATAYLHDYRLIPNSTPGTVTKYAGYVNEACCSENVALLSSEEAEEIAFDAIHGLDKADAVVLGKFGDGGPTAYTNVAKDMDAQYFQLDNWNELAAKYSDDEIWKVNEKFLDIETSSGREIYLSHNPEDYIGKGQFYSKELQYLLDNGYKFINEGGIWHAIR